MRKMKINVNLAWWLVAIVAALLLTSCKSVEPQIIERTHTDTMRLKVYLRDSIYMHDSIRIEKNGDTCFVERWHTAYRDRHHHDTTYISHIDSVPVPYPVEKIVEVEAKLSWWQQLKMHLGGITFWFLVILGVGWVVKRKWI